MPLYDFTCEKGHLFEHFLPLDRYRECPPCPIEGCGAPTERAYLPQGHDAHAFANPVVVYQAPDGSYRFPGATQGRMARQYDQQGYRRVECHNAAEVRQLERSVNARERTRFHEATERQQRRVEDTEHERRQQFHHEMSRMSNLGRDVARAAIDRTNAKRKARSDDAGFRVDALE